MRRRAQIYEEKYLKSVKPFVGVREVFLELSRTGSRIALTTACKGPELKHCRSLLNVDDLIHSIACGDDVEHGKPDPRLIGHALRKLGVPAGEAVMIGDTPYDAEAALGAGFSAAGLVTGGFSRKHLADAGCAVVAKDLHDLLASLKGDPSRLAVAAAG